MDFKILEQFYIFVGKLLKTEAFKDLVKRKGKKNFYNTNKSDKDFFQEFEDVIFEDKDVKNEKNK